MSSSYDQPKEYNAFLGGQRVRYFSRPGFPDWNQPSPAEALLAEGVSLSGVARLLILGSGNGALAVALARSSPGVEITLIDQNFIACEMAARTLEANPGLRARLHPGTSLLPEQAGAYDVVVLRLPKGRKLARRWIMEAAGALRPGGQLYLAGAKDLGILSVARDAEAIFSPGAVLGYKKGSRVVRFILKDSNDSTALPSWATEPGIAPGTWIELDLDTPFGRLQLSSLPGIFSSGEIDDGTRLLLEHLRVTPESEVLDLGCGYGLIGILAARAGARRVDLVDSNLLAVEAAKKNIETQRLSNARALSSDAFSAVHDQRYNLVVTNPPFHTGKAVETETTRTFIRQAAAILRPGGQLLLVANHFLKYDNWMGEYFHTVSQVAATNRYRLWLAVR